MLSHFTMLSHRSKITLAVTHSQLGRKVCFQNAFIPQILKHLSVSGTSKSWHFSCPQGVQARVRGQLMLIKEMLK